MITVMILAFVATIFIPFYFGKKFLMYFIENITILAPKDGNGKSRNKKGKNDLDLQFYRVYDEQKAIGFGLMWLARIKKIVITIVNYIRKLFGLNSIAVTVYEHKEYKDNQRMVSKLSNQKSTNPFNDDERPEAKKFNSGDFY